MDFKKLLNSEIIKKYGIYFLLVIGLFIMIAFSGNNASVKTSASVEETPTAADKNVYINEMQTRLEKMLGQINGVGEVSVMITLQSGTQTVIASDEKYSENVTQNADGETKSQQTNRDSKVATLRDEPLVLQEIEPKVEGVVVVAQGAGNPNVALQINQAVVALLGVKTHKVAVFSKK